MREIKLGNRITPRDSDTLAKYLSEVAHQPMISAEEEVRLAQEIKKGNQEAVNQLVNANLRFVISVANQFAGQGVILQDLIQEGNIGMITAAKKFDETKGFRFISYAVWWIRQAIIQAISDKGKSVRLPQNMVTLQGRINKFEAAYEQQYQHKPSEFEIAEGLDVAESLIHTLKSVNGRQVSVDAPLKEDEDGSLLDLLKSDETPEPDQMLINESLHEDVLNLMRSVLDERELTIMIESFGIGITERYTQEEISIRHGLSKERVRQIREKAIRALRESPGKKQLIKYLG